ncbi:hypothetical protein GCG54_00000717 [Colletotrichum gloeosporioides]|uniref:Uncharacterized protein n=1 Tax=Colletotrichum gloeosporioides TaxID=474922 RepID=A0A8H4FJH4_COLGL|nr:uncharacterized protein GCG54_00000717 [Colletotrichum gloeosporioides]KAF3804365.1 hypothetical protein GCG54_00000717 [Colletotrichum gloeosporioides]
MSSWAIKTFVYKEPDSIVERFMTRRFVPGYWRRSSPITNPIYPVNSPRPCSRIVSKAQIDALSQLNDSLLILLDDSNHRYGSSRYGSRVVLRAVAQGRLSLASLWIEGTKIGIKV